MKTELTWAGKRPYNFTMYYPAQLKERFGEEKDGWRNKIYWGDNLQVMSHLMRDYRSKIDLIYIDPPFDSKADYKKTIKVDNNSFEEIQYKDKWTDDEYLQFMYERLMLMRELLSDKGSIYVHCDWHKSHHLKLILDEILGISNFRNEIVWCYRTSLRSSNKAFGRDHDTILFYSKTSNHEIHPDRKDFPVSDETIKRWGVYADENGFVSNKHFAGSSSTIIDTSDESKGFYINQGIPRDWWEISANVAKGNTSEVIAGKYPTQKPEALLERIIKASSNPGDLVFDCFMGSGTTQAVAMKLGRRFIGADNNSESIQTVIKRLYSIFKSSESVLFDENKRHTGFEVYSLDEDLQNDIETLVSKEENKIVIKSFKSNSLESKLSIPVSDWKQIVDTVMIDWNFKEVFHPSVVDTEVLGEYEIPINAENIVVKITDKVSKSIYVSVKNN